MLMQTFWRYRSLYAMVIASFIFGISIALHEYGWLAGWLAGVSMGTVLAAAMTPHGWGKLWHIPDAPGRPNPEEDC